MRASVDKYSVINFVDISNGAFMAVFRRPLCIERLKRSLLARYKVIEAELCGDDSGYCNLQMVEGGDLFVRYSARVVRVYSSSYSTQTL